MNEDRINNSFRGDKNGSKILNRHELIYLIQFTSDLYWFTSFA